MNGKPQETREGDQADLLEQIIAQGLEKMKAPAQVTAAEEAPAVETVPAPRQEDSEGIAPPTGAKSRRSAVYLYLLILFGAAFLLLLLAYFVQQRSNESTISDLRDSMNLSREELLDEIRDLEEENEGLIGIIDRMSGDIIQWQERYEEQVQDSNSIFERYTDALSRLNGWQNYWALEQSYQAEDYEACVAILLLENMSEFGSTVPQETLERREEITQALIERGFLPEDLSIRISDYQELIDRYLAGHPDYGVIWE